MTSASHKPFLCLEDSAQYYSHHALNGRPSSLSCASLGGGSVSYHGLPWNDTRHSTCKHLPRCRWKIAPVNKQTSPSGYTSGSGNDWQRYARVQGRRGQHTLLAVRVKWTMAIYLVGVPVYTIMPIGRWPSDAFLHYIRRLVQEFSRAVSRCMIMSPYPDENQPSLEDPRAVSDQHKISGRGLNYGQSRQSHALQPAFSLNH
jgi:hypothetical protein